MKICIVIPTYNEAGNLPELLARLSALGLADTEIIIVDDASPDKTAEIARNTLSAYPLTVIVRATERGLGGALLTGLNHALAQGADVVVTMDADLSHEPEVIPKLLAAVNNGAHLCLGSRRIPGGSVKGWSRWRDLVSKTASRLSRLMLGLKAQDVTTGLRAYHVDLLRGIDLGSVRSRGYAFQQEMVMKAEAGGFTVVESPINFIDRTRGASKLSLMEAASSFGSLLKIRLAAPTNGDWLGVTLVFSAALFLRVVLSPAPGSAYDIWAFSHWAAVSSHFHWLSFFTLGPAPILTFPNYALYFPILALYGPGFSNLDPLGRALLKIPSIIGDLVLAYFIYRALPRRYRLAGAAFFLFSPAVWYDSAVWGQTDVWHTLFIFLAALAVAESRLRRAWVFFVLAVFFKLQAIALLPLLIFATLCAGRPRQWLATLAPAAALAAFITLPYALTSGAMNLIHSLFNNVGVFPLVSYNAWNPWYVIQMLSGHLMSDRSTFYFRISLFVYLLVVFAILHRLPKKLDRQSVARASALLCLALFLFVTQMHERYLYQIMPFLALLLFEDAPTAIAVVVISLGIFFDMNYIESWVPPLAFMYSASAGLVWSVLNTAGFVALFRRSRNNDRLA